MLVPNLLIVLEFVSLFQKKQICGGPVGPPAMIPCEPGQVRKEAATAGDSCAGVWLAGLSPFLGYAFSPCLVVSLYSPYLEPIQLRDIFQLRPSVLFCLICFGGWPI